MDKEPRFDPVWEFDAPRFHDFAELPMEDRSEAEAFFRKSENHENIHPYGIEVQVTSKDTMEVLVESPENKDNRKKITARHPTPFKPKTQESQVQQRSLVQKSTPRKMLNLPEVAIEVISMPRTSKPTKAVKIVENRPLTSPKPFSFASKPKKVSQKRPIPVKKSKSSPIKITKPQPFNFSTDKPKQRKPVQTTVPLDFTITKSKTTLKKSKGFAGVPRVQKRELTVPKAFNFSKPRKKSIAPPVTEKRRHTMAPKQSITIPKPFNFHTTSRGSRKDNSEKSRKMSITSTKSLPSNWRCDGMTIPDPFHLLTEERGMHYEKQFKKRVEEAFQEQEQLFGSFRARSVPSFRPFHPVLGQTELTYPEEFSFPSASRVKQRSFQKSTKGRQRKQTDREIEKQKMVEQMEKVKLGAMRVSMLSKQVSQLTEPQSPAFATNARKGRSRSIRR